MIAKKNKRARKFVWKKGDIKIKQSKVKKKVEDKDN